jgi:hypothetical protein
MPRSLCWKALTRPQSRPCVLNEGHPILYPNSWHWRRHGGLEVVQVGLVVANNYFLAIPLMQPAQGFKTSDLEDQDRQERVFVATSQFVKI